MSDVQANIVIKGNTDDAVRGLKKVQDSVKDLDKQVSGTKNVFKEFAGGLGGITAAVAGGQGIAYAAQKAGQSLLQLGRETLRAADDLQALESRAKVIYGEALPGVSAEIGKFSQQVGRSHSDLLNFAAGFAAIAQGANLPKQASADLSVQLAKLTTDFGSFFHVADDEAFHLIQGGLLGMGRTLARYGIVLNATTLDEYAHAQGIKTKTADMNEAQLVALRYNFLLDKTREIQGDATANAHSFSNEVKSLSAQWKDFEEVAGTPVIEGLARALGGVTEVVGGLRAEVQGLANDLRNLPGVGAAAKGAAFGMGFGPLKGLFGTAQPSVLDLNSPGLSVALETPQQTAARRQKEVQAQINSYAGLGGGGSGGKGKDEAKKLADELARAEKQITQAFAEQARVTKDVAKTRRDELQLRERLGILTKDEGRELDSINRRIAFKKDLVDEATKAWEKEAQAVKQTETKVKELTDRIADQKRQLAEELRQIDTDFSRRRTDEVGKLITEQKDLDDRLRFYQGLSPQQQERAKELQGIIAKLSPSEVAAGQAENALDPLQRLEQEKQRRIQDATEKANYRVSELQAELTAEQQKLQAVKDAEFQKYQAVVTALSDRTTAVKQALNDELESVRANVSAQVSEYNKLRSPGSVKPPAGVPAFGDGGIVTRPTLALIGERGPEAVVPLGKGVPGITIGAIHVHDAADEDRLIQKLTRLIQLQGLGSS